MTELQQSLKTFFGYDSFRPYQEQIIQTILAKQDVLAILPTGAGKSLCYQLPALMMPGTCVVISPLIALMQDQVRQLHELGIAAAYINSALSVQEKCDIYAHLGTFKLLYVSPEKFADPEWIAMLDTLTIASVIIDEAHCISQWGHSFRPDYRKLSKLKLQFPKAVVAAFTATATTTVAEDICSQLGLSHPEVITGDFDRENLMIRFHERRQYKDQILRVLNARKEESGIIYVPTRKKVDQISQWLADNQLLVASYHAGMSTAEREQAQADFVYDRVQIMVATLAFGMGINKPDIRFVIHVGMPQNMEQYYQEIGRAGRDGEPAETLCLYSTQDIILQKQFAHHEPDLTVRHHLLQKINQMSAFCQSAQCRRVDLLHYFGQEYKNTCQSCDNCTDTIEWMEGTIIAQQILSCVYRLNQSFGVQHVIHVLRGSKNKSIQDRGHERLSTYGLLSEFSAADVRYFIYALINQSFLVITEGQYPVLKLTETSRQVLFENKQIQFKQRYKVKSAVKQSAKELNYSQDVYNALHSLRKSLADERGVPAYMVFHNRTLKHIATTLPQTREALLDVNGIGPEKLNLFGDVVLKTLQPFQVTVSSSET